MLNIFEFSQVWENIESWLVYANKLFWIAEPYFSTTLFFCKNKLCKNNEAEIGQKIRTNLEHFEAQKFRDKKIKMMNYISSKQVTKNDLNAIKVIKNIKKH